MVTDLARLASDMPSWKKMAESFRSPRKIARRLKYLPLAITKVRNWPAFMFHYALGLKPKGAYVFCNGAQLIISRAIDHVPIIEIFLNEDYGTISDKSVVIDLGANIGVFTIYATTTARSVRVYAYEPCPDFCAILKENVRLNRRNETVHCFNLAVASEVGTRDLYMSGGEFFFPTLIGATNHENQERVEVRCTTLAQIMESNHLEHVDLLKMDCEGAEYEILYSTPCARLQRIGEIRMEYHNLDSGERHVDGLQRFFTKNGFTVTHLQPTSETNGTLWVERERPFRRAA
jgi:FkbM family methyltransferase